MKNKHILVGLGCLTLFFIMVLNAWQINPSSQELDPETIKIMPFVSDSNTCLKCHQTEESENLKPLTNSCDQYCISCHKEMDSHHKTGFEFPDDPPEKVFLRDKNLVCVSCHDLKAKRFDNKPWKSRSLFGRMFKGKSKYQTYYLIINNRKGQLCKKCH